MEKYNVDYFIKKFEAIAEWRWTEGVFTKMILGFIPTHCAYGHCGHNGSISDNPEVIGLLKLDRQLDTTIRLTSVNDGHDYRYQQATPKQRVLAALYDLKKQQEKKIVYVSVDKEVRELQKKELVLN